jgi:hypothetical protein
LFQKANLFGSCIIHILYTECAKITKNNSGAKGLMEISQRISIISIPCGLLNRGIGVRISAEEKDSFFLISKAIRPVMGLTQPGLELVTGYFPRDKAA